MLSASANVHMVSARGPRRPLGGWERVRACIASAGADCRGTPGPYPSVDDVHLEDRRFDTAQVPAVYEGGLDVAATDAARAPLSGSRVAEHQHVVEAADRRDAADRVDVAGPGGVVEKMEHTAVQDRVEDGVEDAEVHGVGHLEPCPGEPTVDRS